MTRAQLVTTADSFSVEGIIDFDSAVDLEVVGSRWLAETAPEHCRLDLCGVSYSNSAGIALVLAWLRTAQRYHRQLRVENIPPSLWAIIRLGGLESLFPAPANAEATAHERRQGTTTENQK